MENENESIVINSYQKVWGFEKLVYEIFKIPLPTPVVEADIMFAFGSLLLVIAVRTIVPIPLNSVNMLMLYYIGLPLMITAILRHKTFDGKNPLAFASDYLHFFFTERTQKLEYFVRVADSPAHIVSWQLGYRHRLRQRRSSNGK